MKGRTTSMARRKPTIHVQFKPTKDWFLSSDHHYGGRGILSAPTPWTGPITWKIEGHDRKFVVTRLVRSPTGSGVGSFAIDEVVKIRGFVTTVRRGYSCSFPDYDICKRVARKDHQ